MMNLVEKAALFAAQAHAGQVRKYTGAPYTEHTVAVAHAVALAGADEATVAAAHLHDTLEDTATTHADLVAAFGVEVADLVVELTDVFTPQAFPHLNRKARKALEAQRLGTVSARAKMVKRADVADNAVSIEAHDPSFAKVWLAEKAAMLNAMEG